MSKRTLLYRLSLFSVLKIYSYLSLWKAAWSCVFLVIRHFFLLQYKAALFPRRYPLSDVGHPLDEKIPFKPGWVAIYMDFATLWIRTQGFLLQTFKKSEIIPIVRDYINSMTALYLTAGKVYRKNMSTTERPAYYGKPQFISIHILDPHLMCVPSLHVMSAIRTYTVFRDILTKLGAEERYAAEIDFVHKRAIGITESILYVKQHSVNCIPAAMYAMTRYSPDLFPPDEAERFAEALFQNPEGIAPEAVSEIKNCILALYHQFLAEGEAACKSGGDWTKPLLDFLAVRRRGNPAPAYRAG